ncbi:hypothetical protein [Kitasatospora sp. DSM 101779]|uniref:hypothetical protein n=1 Tax=Kitasatospora sp. DSM 101779 TaxID=2853165 RepID=UPI0021D8608D|nr:hypothetical protein [Kitasatospora sp. DSM 101779]MCU7825718.1 hypothetical protein [Kitasatospora sp. DSM 101779]
MGNEQAAKRFWTELRDLWEAAGRPPLKALVRIGEREQPPVTVSDATLSSWLTAVSVPGPRSSAYFRLLVRRLHEDAGRVHTVAFDRGWERLLTDAVAERKAKQGRPSTTATVAAQARPAPAAPSNRPLLYFRAGCSAGWKLTMVPVGDEASSDTRLAEFLGVLGNLGFSAAELAPLHELTQRIRTAESKEELTRLLYAFSDAVGAIGDLARQRATSGEFIWFTLGRLLYTICFIAVGTWPDEEGRELAELRSELFELGDLLDGPDRLVSAIRSYATMPLPTTARENIATRLDLLDQACTAHLSPYGPTE